MKYDYLTVVGQDFRKRFIRRPMVEVEIFGPNESYTVLALVDSGADRSLFNIEIAKILGIDLKKAKKDIVLGIFGKNEVYAMDVDIKIKHLEGKIKIPVSFIDS
ncbi:MAG: hypothetical protein AAB451_02710 [Patescibacteria group bacterium]